MAVPCLFTLTSSTHRNRVSALRDVRYHLRTYLDEKGKLRLNARADRSRQTPLASPEAPVLPGLVQETSGARVILPPDYYRGRLTVGGFMRERMVLAGFGRNSPKLLVGRMQWTERCAREWAKELGRYRSYSKKKGPLTRHNFSLSLDEATTAMLTASGVSAPVILEQVLERTFKRYMAENGYAADDKLGYVYGFHMDTRNLHIQLSLFPRTKNGEVVKLTEMVRSTDVKRGPEQGFLNNLSRFACQEMEGMVADIKGRNRLLHVPARENAHNLFRAQRVYDGFTRMKPADGYVQLEQDLLRSFRAAEGGTDLPVAELLALFRRYVGATSEQAKASLDYSAKTENMPDVVRRMSRLWLGYTYSVLEKEEDTERQRAGLPGAPSAPGLPSNLRAAYDDYWSKVYSQRPKPILGKEVRDLLKRKRDAAARDIQGHMLPDPHILQPELSQAGSWGSRFLAFLDQHLLFGSGVFFTRLTLKELELGVSLRAAATRFLQRESVGLPAKSERETQTPVPTPAPADPKSEPDTPKR